LNRDVYSDVGFANTIKVEIGRSPTGKIYTYRESIAWTSLKEAIIGFQADRFHEAMSEAYPFLGREELAELRGLMTGYYAYALSSMQQAENETMTDKAVVSSLTSDAKRIIRRRHPDADVSAVAEITERLAHDSDDELDEFIKEILPGVYLAFITSLRLSLTMPGKVVESNADEVDGQTLVWKEIGFIDAFNKPIELYARSEVSE
jgi:hypothetical protein